MNTSSIRYILTMMLFLFVVGIAVGALIFESAALGAAVGGSFAVLAALQQLLLKASQPFWDWLDNVFTGRPKV